MKKYLLIFISVFTLTFTAKAQDGFENILLADAADAKKLMQGYFNPAMKGFIYGMNNGWYHTAKVHKILGFDLTIGGNLSMIPTKDEIFTASGLTSISPNSVTSPTFGGDANGASLTVSRTVTITDPTSPAFGQSEVVTAPLSLPGGIKNDLPLNAVPAPIAQLNVGLPFKMEAMIRYFPETDLGDDGGKAKMLGLGLKKEITSWFGPLDKLPLHVSLLAAYTSMDVSYGFANQNSGAFQVNNASAQFSLTSYTVQAIASLNFPFINIYGGFGYSSGESTLKMTGTYTGEYDYTVGGQNYKESISITPPDLAFNASGVRTTLGARISLGFLKIFADYTLQEFNTVSAGVAISIR